MDLTHWHGDEIPTVHAVHELTYRERGDRTISGRSGDRRIR
jgi:hypothetical protein